MALTATQKYLKVFFEEKALVPRDWEIASPNGTMHLISNEVVIEHILLASSDEEQDQIAMVLRKIDFHNGNVDDFLKHLAGALVQNF